MQRFPLTILAQLTGIKASTLRIWEQRYEFFKSLQKAGNQRLYSKEDFKKFLQIAFLYHNGWPVAQITSLSDEQITGAAKNIRLTELNYQAFILKLMEAATELNEAEFSSTLNRLIKKVGIETAILQVCYPYLQRLSLLPGPDKMIPAGERFSIYIIQSLLISESQRLSTTQNESPEMILFCPEDNCHELPLLYLNYLLRKWRWKVLYLGKDVRLEALQAASQPDEIKFLFVHFSVPYSGWHIDDYFEKIRKTFPDKIIIASGKGVEKSQRSFVNLMQLKSDDEIHRFIRNRNQLLGST